MKNICFFILTVIMVSSCLDQPDCVREASSDIIFQFKRANDGRNRSMSFDSVVIAGADSVMYQGESSSTVIFPLDAVNDTTSVIFYSTIATDTLVVEYRKFSRLISPDCGPETFFLDLDIRSHSFDSVRLVNRNILPDEEPNIEIYY